jgi:hypothetical protein
MRPVRVLVHAGEVDRTATLIRANVSAEKPTSLGSTSGGESITLRDEATGQLVPAQYDPAAELLSFVLDGPLPAGQSRSFQATTEPVEPAFPATLTAKLDRVELGVAGELFATYLTSGARRPYFWPVLGPSGASVVRGQGSADHPHHTGLALNYGGHGEGGSVNLWSDWDEPPYGPGGRMLHRGFRRLQTGPVYGELVQDLTYLDAYGDPFATEVRTIRWWWAGQARRFLDLDCRIVDVTDRGTRPFIMMIRTPDSFAVPGHGRVTNSSTGQTPDVVYTAADQYRAAWVDASGPTGGPPPAPPAGPPEELPDLVASSKTYQEPGTGPWNGIALLDHPGNDGYPNVVGKYATVQQVTQAHYPPADAPQGPFGFQHRVFVHDGDADAAGIETVAADYGTSCRVEVES